ncbi:MAG: N-acylglucosamine 2-epimerase [Clostridia bacterium]|jgi:N-acylglucosamine 2-epimerase|nr:N-acylglucosamine 2-epimerase [Clostridia bacterium]
MDKARISELKNIYKQELLGNVMPFWERYGIDEEMGGYIHYLGTKGDVLCDDKNIWVQGRACWVFSRLYNTVEKRPQWLEYAKLGYEFFRKHGFDERGKMYFTVTRDGRPLRMRRYYFSETFAIIAAAEYGKAAGDEDAKKFAEELFDTVCGYYYEPDPELTPSKVDPVTRPSTGHAVPMILIATAQVLRECGAGDAKKYDKAIAGFIEIILSKFVKRDLKALLEMSAPDGSVIDTPSGREINPGHAIETSWFMMHEGMVQKDERIIKSACEILEWSFERGWDEEYGGLLSFVDLKGLPPEKMEWDMKYWWPHNELIYASLLAYHLTGEDKYERMFERAHEYSFEKFSDPENGGWFGYLHRDGSVAMEVKGTMFKGPFHVPRQLLYTWQLLEKMEA